MKKNKMMRIASVLLVAVLLSTSIISGTFAKYVTEGSASDSARVAKFGVTVAATGSLFDKTYKTTENTPGGSTLDENFTEPNTAALSVESTADVVAPGTKNTDGLTFSVTGTPEVDVNVKLDFTTTEDVFLKAGTYKDMTKAVYDKTKTATAYSTEFTFDDADYYPLVFTLQGDYLKAADLSSVNGLNTTAKATDGKVSGTLAQIKAVFAALNGANGIFVDANTNLANVAAGGIGTFKLTWEWAFGDPTNNQKDTVLGDLAADTYAGTDLTDGEDYNLDVNASLKITVAQVD
ncbi:MAG: hypothetical protein J1E81_08840 [Eubacterium sp.]|nr:hypothetical protein [Eubacterium sp.]